MAEERFESHSNFTETLECHPMSSNEAFSVFFLIVYLDCTWVDCLSIWTTKRFYGLKVLDTDLLPNNILFFYFNCITSCFTNMLLLFAVTHMHQQKLHLVLSDPPPDALPRPEPKGQRSEPCSLASLALLPAAVPPAGVKALWVLKHVCTPPKRVKTHLDHRLNDPKSVKVSEGIKITVHSRVQTHPSRYVVILKNDIFDRIPLYCGSHRI